MRKKRKDEKKAMSLGGKGEKGGMEEKARKGRKREARRNGGE